jgi:hypothetical protein
VDTQTDAGTLPYHLHIPVENISRHKKAALLKAYGKIVHETTPIQVI